MIRCISCTIPNSFPGSRFDESGKCIIACSKEYFRPLEVDTLLGDSKKAKKELNWKPKTSVKLLVKEMVNFDLNNLINDK